MHNIVYWFAFQKPVIHLSVLLDTDVPPFQPQESHFAIPHVTLTMEDVILSFKTVMKPCMDVLTILYPAKDLCSVLTKVFLISYIHVPAETYTVCSYRTKFCSDLIRACFSHLLHCHPNRSWSFLIDHGLSSFLNKHKAKYVSRVCHLTQKICDVHHVTPKVFYVNRVTLPSVLY